MEDLPNPERLTDGLTYAELVAEARAAAEADPIARHELAYLTPELIADAATTRANLAEQAETTGPLSPEEAAQLYEIHKAAATRLGFETVSEYLLSDQNAESSAGPGPGLPSLIVPMSVFLTENDAPNLDVVPRIIPADGLSLWIGRKEAFKTMTTMTLHVACATGVDWLGFPVLPMRSVYVSNEKRRRSVRERFRSMIGSAELHHEIGIVHRAGLILDPASDRWRRFVDEVDAMDERVLVTLDTLTSLAPPGFKENSPEGMAVVLGAVRMLTSLPTPATAILLHHPAWADQAGKEMRGRGHSSLEGEHDGLLSFDRPDREKDEAVIHVRPKDGDYQLLLIAWDRDSMRVVRRDTLGMPLTIETAVAIVAGLGEGATVDRVRQALGTDRMSGRPRFGDDHVRNVLNGAVQAGQLTASGGSRGHERTYAIREEEP